MSEPPRASATRSTAAGSLVSPTIETSVSLSSRSRPATRAPPRVSASAVARPIPDAEPVTTARLPSSTCGLGDRRAVRDDVDELAGGLVLEDQLDAPVRHLLLLDDRLAVALATWSLDARDAAAAPVGELDRLPLPRGGRPVARVDDRIDDVAVVERLHRRA